MGDRMKVSASSQTALLAFGAVLTVIGGMIPSPGGSLLCLVTAGLVACAALFSGRSRRKRAVACLILAVVVFQVLSVWRPYRASLDRYRDGAPLSDTKEVPD